MAAFRLVKIWLRSFTKARRNTDEGMHHNSNGDRGEDDKRIENIDTKLSKVLSSDLKN